MVVKEKYSRMRGAKSAVVFLGSSRLNPLGISGVRRPVVFERVQRDLGSHSSQK